MRRLFWTNFFSLLLVVVALAQWICATWLLRELAGVQFGRALNIAGPVLLYALNRLIVTRRMPPPGVSRTLRRAYTGAAFTSLFGLLFLTICGLFWLLATLGASAVALAAGDMPDTAPVARTLRAVATGGLVAISGMMAYGYSIGQRRLWINRVSVPVESLPPALEGLRVVQISDVHLGGFTSPARVARYVERANALDPDLTVLTGDITDGLDHAEETFPILGRLRARHGVIAILGNHDVYTGEDEVAAALGTYTQMRVLLDQTAQVDVADETLHVVGLRDRGLDWARGLPECGELKRLWSQIPDGAPALLLCHRPDLFGYAARLGVPLMLSGHTHGGQVALPIAPGRSATLARFMTRYPGGTYREGNSFLHVNLGLGLTGQPVRFGCPREITEITLTAA